jgi:hypothetical protein
VEECNLELQPSQLSEPTFPPYPVKQLFCCDSVIRDS